MDDLIIISNLNDFIFCPASIYFHKLYGSEDTIMYQSKAQLDGTKAHEKIDNGTYSTRKNILMAIDVYSENMVSLEKSICTTKIRNCLLSVKNM